MDSIFHVSDGKQKMRIIIDVVPVSLNKLLRMCWAARNDYNNRWKMLVRAAIPAPQEPPAGKQSVYIAQTRRRLLDPDNLYAACKPILDALKTWGLIADDSPAHISLTVFQRVGKEKQTQIDIEPYEEPCG